MILQNVGEKQLVYVKDYQKDYLDVAREFGMLKPDGTLESYAQMNYDPYHNGNGIAMPSVHLVGKTVNIHVVNDTIQAKGVTYQELVDALNYFPPDSHIDFAGHTFVSRFKKGNNYSVIADSAKREFSISDNRKDLRGIHDLMNHLDLNNGKLFEPVIARYVYTSREMPKHMPLVGYFDLEEYLRVIRDDRSRLFNMTRTHALVNLEFGPVNPCFTITAVKNNYAILTSKNIVGAYDINKIKEMKPLVILSRRPLKIRTMTFPWSKVTFDKTTVFMTPIMSMRDAWETLQGGLDLLSAPQSP